MYYTGLPSGLLPNSDPGYSASGLGFNSVLSTNYFYDMVYGELPLAYFVNSITVACPQAKIILASYSQGAFVVRKYVNDLSTTTDSTAPVPVTTYSAYPSGLLPNGANCGYGTESTPALPTTVSYCVAGILSGESSTPDAPNIEGAILLADPAKPLTGVLNLRPGIQSILDNIGTRYDSLATAASLICLDNLISACSARLADGVQTINNLVTDFANLPASVGPLPDPTGVPYYYADYAGDLAASGYTALAPAIPAINSLISNLGDPAALQILEDDAPLSTIAAVVTLYMKDNPVHSNYQNTPIDRTITNVVNAWS